MGMIVGASTQKLDTNTGKYKNTTKVRTNVNTNVKSSKSKNTKYSTHSSTCTKDSTRKACAQNMYNDDVMRSKAGSYLMAARGLLKKVSQIDCSLSLVNLK